MATKDHWFKDSPRDSASDTPAHCDKKTSHYRHLGKSMEDSDNPLSDPIATERTWDRLKITDLADDILSWDPQELSHRWFEPLCNGSPSDPRSLAS
jgi:hypothetical protein